MPEEQQDLVRLGEAPGILDAGHDPMTIELLEQLARGE